MLDEGHHIADVARDSLEVEGDITLVSLQAQLDNLSRFVTQYLQQFRPVKPPKLADSARLQKHLDAMSDVYRDVAMYTQALLPAGGTGAAGRKTVLSD